MALVRGHRGNYGWLLGNWRAYTPKVQDAVVEEIFGRQNRLPSLLDAIGEEVVPASAQACGASK